MGIYLQGLSYLNWPKPSNLCNKKPEITYNEIYNVNLKNQIYIFKENKT